MFENISICPYPGLRSFNEEESLYFKGRDHHTVEVIKLLQKNKFLMVTGASGDGKSSLIFGGLVPNARAGFFKAKYTNWKVVHFRPERSSLRNFSTSLSKELDYANVDTVETELKRGFSSLVDLYKNSPFYVDKNSNTADEGKRKSSNLLIIADQFEEFFTNPENFHQGAPSLDAQTTVNLLLETARIALKDDLPIFVVFTMRSDYIGQCTAFRGLPEHIGFSQFFVPRLKRKELQQVIEEPAVLSGIRISRRLVERLIYDLEEGVDQLPILQHALNQIWLAADSGSEELDLIHYAMVGGMPAGELPDSDQQKFKNWVNALPLWKQKLFDQPSLKKVLDVHADMLYYSAWEYYNKKNSDHLISSQEAKRIIALTFACLTKIDESRAVRNRMSLKEITQIINTPSLNMDVVAGVINYFRDTGNTFIHPFIVEDQPDSEVLKPDGALDITHEALIRNWKRLDKWANKEYQFYETYRDLKKQLDRWVDSNRSNDFLLPIGPLVYFENWYKECQPNAHWINRYSDSALDNESKLQESKTILSNIKAYLKQSARKVVVTKTFMKYGPRKVATFFAILFVVTLSSFFFIDAERKQNHQVLQVINDEGIELVRNSEANAIVKGIFLLNSERLQEGNMFQFLDQMPTTQESVDAGINAYLVALTADSRFRHPAKMKLIKHISLNLSNLEGEEEVKIGDKLELYNDFMTNLFYDRYFNESDALNTQIEFEKQRLFNWVMDALKTPDKVSKVTEINEALEHVLNAGLSQGQIEHLLSGLSPFKDEVARSNFAELFPQGESINFGFGNQTLSHNGGYYIVSCLYAASGDLPMAKQSVDSVMAYNTNFFAERIYTNGHNIIGYLQQYQHSDLIDPMAAYFAKKRNINKHLVYKELIDRAGSMSYASTFKAINKEYYNLNLKLLQPGDNLHWFDLREEAIQKELTGDAKIYELALLYKQKAIFAHKIAVDKGLEFNEAEINAWLNKSLQFYQAVSPNFLEERISIGYSYYSTGIRRTTLSRQKHYLYPDHSMDGWYSRRYNSSLWVDFVIANSSFKELYSSTQELEYFNDWLSNYLEIYPYGEINRANYLPIPAATLERLLATIHQHPSSSGFDFNLINLLLANIDFKAGKNDEALDHFRSLSQQSLPITANRWEYLNFTSIYNEMVTLAVHLGKLGMHVDAISVANTFPDRNYRAAVYSKIAGALYEDNMTDKVFVYLDSAFQNRNLIDENTLGVFDYRYYMINSLSKIGGKDLNEISTTILTNMPDFKKPNGIIQYVSGLAHEGNYFRAKESIASDMSVTNELSCFNEILGAEIEYTSGGAALAGWENYDAFWDHLTNYIVFNANF